MSYYTWTWQVAYPSQNSNVISTSGPSHQTIEYVYQYLQPCDWVSDETPQYRGEPKPPVMPERLM
jgi:hypothetical protein